MQRERLAARGARDDAIAHVECPVGIDIAAQTAEEIAVAVCARLIQVRRSPDETRANA
jgi:xanthine/CO dehydrogenase XdhC/CoxF family maturation factor